MEKKSTHLRNFILFLAAAAALSLGVWLFFFGRDKDGKDTELPGSDRVDTGFVVTGPDSFDSADTAILVDKDEKEGKVTFLNLVLGKRYTLTMDGTTRLYDKYGDAVAIGQIEVGDIVDVTFLKSRKHLTTMKLSATAWVYGNVERYEMDFVRGEMSIGSEVYKLTSNTQYVSEGRSIEAMDLNPEDVLEVQGIDKQVLSVRVEKGHGYLRLTNDENFVGGWIEIGKTKIQRITEDMLLLVPEGNYQVSISHRGGGGTKSVAIRRDEETTLDIGDLEIPEPQTGMVVFSLTPPDAELYVDGEKAEASTPVVLEYGLHQIIVRAEGYQSITQYIRVAQESVGINVSLDTVAGAEEQEKDQDEDSSSSSEADTTTNYYKVYVDAPEGAEVYLDGNYVGISPCSFKKVAGVHVLILRKSGFETKSVTIQLDDSDKDMSYSFADLTPQTEREAETARLTRPLRETQRGQEVHVYGQNLLTNAAKIGIFIFASMRQL